MKKRKREEFIGSRIEGNTDPNQRPLRYYVFLDRALGATYF